VVQLTEEGQSKARPVEVVHDDKDGKEVLDINNIDPLALAKAFQQQDIKMDQSAVILQAILGKNFGSKITGNGNGKDALVQLFSTGQIVNVNGGECELPHTALRKLLMKLPQPRMQNLMKMIHDIAYFMHGGDGMKASEFLGLDHEGQAAVEGNSQNFSGSMLEMTERQTVLKALEQSQWRQNKAAELLGISSRALNYKIKKFGITHEAWRKNKPEAWRKNKPTAQGAQDLLEVSGHAGAAEEEVVPEEEVVEKKETPEEDVPLWELLGSGQSDTAETPEPEEETVVVPQPVDMAIIDMPVHTKTKNVFTKAGFENISELAGKTSAWCRENGIKSHNSMVKMNDILEAQGFQGIQWRYKKKKKAGGEPE